MGGFLGGEALFDNSHVNVSDSQVKAERHFYIAFLFIWSSQFQIVQQLGLRHWFLPTVEGVRPKEIVVHDVKVSFSLRHAIIFLQSEELFILTIAGKDIILVDVPTGGYRLLFESSRTQQPLDIFQIVEEQVISRSYGSIALLNQRELVASKRKTFLSFKGMVNKGHAWPVLVIVCQADLHLAGDLPGDDVVLDEVDLHQVVGFNGATFVHLLLLARVV